MDDLINMVFFILIIILIIVYFKDINYKKIITLIKNRDYINNDNQIWIIYKRKLKLLRGMLMAFEAEF